MRAAVAIEDRHIAGLLHALPEGERPDVEELRAGILGAAYSRALVAGDDVLCLFGVVPGFGYGAAWMLGTPHTTKHARWFVEESKRQVAAMLIQFPRLRAIVDERYQRKTIKWLRRMGWRISPPVEWRGVPHRICEVWR